MKTLVFEVQNWGVPLRWLGEPPARSWPVDLSESLKQILKEWNERFGAIIARQDLYDLDQLKVIKGDLNEEGQKLALLIENEIVGKFKVKFHPEIT